MHFAPGHFSTSHHMRLWWPPRQVVLSKFQNSAYMAREADMQPPAYVGLPLKHRKLDIPKTVDKHSCHRSNLQWQRLTYVALFSLQPTRQRCTTCTSPCKHYYTKFGLSSDTYQANNTASLRWRNVLRLRSHVQTVTCSHSASIPP